MPPRSTVSSIQAAALLDDDALAARGSDLIARLTAARVAVAAVPISPATRGFLGLSAMLATPDALREAAADKLTGRLLVSQLLVPHEHTPHCGQACVIRFAQHTHSAACNHARSPAAEVLRSAKHGDIASLEAALAAGGSTEEAGEVSMHFSKEG